MYLDDLGADLKGSGAELLAGTVGILSMNHTDVSTAPGRNHLERHKKTILHREREGEMTRTQSENGE